VLKPPPPTPVLKKTASMPNVDVQLKVCVPLFHVAVMEPGANVNVPLAGGSIFTCSHTWPPPNSPSKSSQVGLPARDWWVVEVWTEWPGPGGWAPTGPATGPTRARVVIPATASQPRRRNRDARRRAKLVCMRFPLETAAGTAAN
jgi:hypothetical protein